MGHKHVEDGQGWTEWDREAIAAGAEEKPEEYKGVKVKKVKLCECGEIMATQIIYEK